MTTNKEFDPRLTTTQTVTNWSGKPVVVKYAGRCLGCNSTVYDGADDPRGVTGPKHFNETITLEDDNQSVTLPACFECMNDGVKYEHARERAIRQIQATGP